MTDEFEPSLVKSAESAVWDVQSIPFWQGLRGDVATIEKERGLTFEHFLRYFDPKTNPRAWKKQLGMGKYGSIFYPATNPDFTSAHWFLAYGFSPDSESTELARLVQETRELMKDRFTDIWFSDRPSKSLSDPKFWETFVSDARKFDYRDFKTFLIHGNPDTESHLNRNRWSENGKYYPLYCDIASNLPESQTVRTGKVTISTLVGQTIYEAAPSYVKYILAAQFPGDFAISEEDLEKSQIFSSDILHLVATGSLLQSDIKEELLKALSNYAALRQPKSTTGNLHAWEIERIFNTVASTPTPKARTVIPATFQEAVQDLRGINTVIAETHNPDKELAESAETLLEALARSYYTLLFKSLLYKPTALFWSLYQEKQGTHPTGATIINFVRIQAQQKLAEAVDNRQAGEVVKFFANSVLKNVYDEFGQIAEYATQIKYFKGGKDHLLFHQVEGIKELMEKNGGILADEPGTGKTVELVLAALNLLDRNQKRGKAPGRVLVVGTNSVINNWEKEWGLHVDKDAARLVNTNFADTNKVAERLRRLGIYLREPATKKQVFLVNYDMFRREDFQKLLEEYPFDIVIVDEAHNVKSRFFEAVDKNLRGVTSRSKNLAKRTVGLYDYITANPSTTVFLATSTPFVKELIEPLIMAHLVTPQRVPLEMVKRLMFSNNLPVTSNILRGAMTRRLKKEIADLPPKNTVLVPIDLESMSEKDKKEFIKAGSECIKTHEKEMSRFYSVWSLENQAKFPWLIEKVQELLKAGRKVLVFTPFVHESDRLTAEISTRAIAARLTGAGVQSVGILDGSLSNTEELEAQQAFLDQNGIKVLVGSYPTAGESITLNSPVNRATEVIILAAPNVIHRFIQAEDRVHRLNQEETVTVHIPYVKGDLFGREQTYDERVIARLFDELTTYEAIMGGTFFVETSDIYETVAREPFKISKPLEINVGVRRPTGSKPISQTQKITPAAPAQTSEPDQTNQEILPVDLDIFGQGADLVWDGGTLDTLNVYLREATDHPILTREQEQIAFRHLKSGSLLQDLANNPEFQNTIPADQKAQFARVFARSKTVKEFLARCNLRYVIFHARKPGLLPFEERIQAGSIGLLTALDRFDPDKGNKFSTFAVWWIFQSIERTTDEQAHAIRLPVNRLTNIHKVNRVRDVFATEHGRLPTDDELEKRVLAETNLTKSQFSETLDEIKQGLWHVASLDKPVGDDEKTAFGDLIPDDRVDTENSVITEIADENFKRDLAAIMENTLSPSEARILSLRFGFDSGESMSLAEIGGLLGITRERVRQKLEEIMGKLRHEPALRWLAQNRLKKELPDSLLWHGLNTDEAAAKLGILEYTDKPHPGSLLAAWNYILAAKEEDDKAFKNLQRMSSQALGNPDVGKKLSGNEKKVLESLGQDSSYKLSQSRIGKLFGSLKPKEVDDLLENLLLQIQQLLLGRKEQSVSLRNWRIYAEVAKLKERGLSYSEIASELNLYPDTLSGILNRLTAEGEIEATEN